MRSFAEKYKQEGHQFRSGALEFCDFIQTLDFVPRDVAFKIQKKLVDILESKDLPNPAMKGFSVRQAFKIEDSE